MAYYIVNENAQSTGEHEVHVRPRSECSSPGYPALENRKDLGWHSDCQSAVRKAREYYSNVDGCYYCSNACHTK